MKEAITKSLKYIDEHIEEHFELQDIADEVGYSKYHFSRIFKKHMNQTINEYVTEKRLILAVRDIILGHRILDVALKYHYTTHTGFAKAFKKYFSYSPSMLSSIKFIENMLLDERRSRMAKDELYVELKSYFHAASKKEQGNLKFAYEVASKSFPDMKRYSGEEYVTHPLNVGLILSQMDAPMNTIILGILHDCTNYKDLESIFGQDMIKKVKRIQDFSNFNLLLEELELDDEEDILLVKLADRLHNMQTIKYINEDRWQLKAKETLDVFSPLAEKMGQIDLKIQLDKLSLELF